MARKGRLLERLVALLEETLGAEEATIKSPDLLPDRDTGALREVDVSIRLRVGSVQMLVIAECRDHRRKQDSTWIEQLAEKRLSVGAAKVLAVARGGFTAPAEKKAKALQIECRRFDSLTPESVRDALQIEGFTLLLCRSHLIDAKVGVVPKSGNRHVGGASPRDLTLRRETDSMTDRVFVLQDGQTLGLPELFDQLKLKEEFDSHSGVPADGTQVRRKFQADVPEGLIKCVSPWGLASVRQLEWTFDLWHERIPLEPTSAHVYRSPEETFVETLEYRVDLRDDGLDEQVISLHRNLQTGQVGITRRPADEAKADDDLSPAWIRMKVVPRNRT